MTRGGRRNAEIAAALTLSQAPRFGDPSFRAHLICISVVDVGQVQCFNLMSDDKVLTPCRNELSKQGLKYQTAHMIAYRFPRVRNHNGVVAFRIMFIITTVAAH